MPNLNPNEVSELAKNFLTFAQTIGDFRSNNWNTLPAEENRMLSDFQFSIMNYGEDILAFSTVLCMNDVETSLSKINQITSDISSNVRNLKNIQKTINLAGTIVTFGGSIISKNPDSIAIAIEKLISAWKDLKSDA